MNNINSHLAHGTYRLGRNLVRRSGCVAMVLLLLVEARIQAQAPTKLPVELTVRQALDIALVNNAIIRVAQADLDQAAGRYDQSRGVLLPQVSVFARQGVQTVNLQGFGLEVQGAPSVIGPFGSMDARVLLTQDLLNIANIRSSKSYSLRRESSTFRLGNAREVVTLNVVGAYLEAMRAKVSRDTLVEQTKLANELYQISSDRFKQGVSSELDTNRAKQQVNSLEQLRQEAEYSYIAAKLNLAQLLQANITTDFEVSDQAVYGTGQAMDREATVQAALMARPDYKAAAAAVSAAELQIKSIEATRLPTVKMRVSDGQSGNSPVHNVNVYSLQGSIEFPIFTSGRISGEIHEAEGRLREATATLDKNRAQIEADALTAVSGVEWALREVQTSAENVGLSRREVEMSRARFVQGIADNTEVVNAQDRLSRADEASIRAQYTLGLARANLARAVGGAERTYRR